MGTVALTLTLPARAYLRSQTDFALPARAEDLGIRTSESNRVVASQSRRFGHPDRHPGQGVQIQVSASSPRGRGESKKTYEQVEMKSSRVEATGDLRVRQPKTSGVEANSSELSIKSKRLIGVKDRGIQTWWK